MKKFINRYSIVNLFGYKNISIDFSENCYILVGENGSGKTTILNCLFYVLAQKTDLLSKIRFDKIILEYANNKKIEITKKEIEAKVAKDEGFSNSPFYRSIQRDLKPSQISNLRRIVISDKPQSLKEANVMAELNKLGFNFRTPSNFVYRTITKIVQEQMAEELEHKYDELESILNYNIIFMPTYRRIESSMFNFENMIKKYANGNPFFDAEDINFDFIKNNEEIRYGMRDVQAKIEGITLLINKKTKDSFPMIMANLLTFLSSNNLKSERNCNFDSSVVNIVLDRLGDQITYSVKEQIRKYITSSNLNNDNLNYLISSLVSLYKEQEKLDLAIKQFRDICNRYLFDKQFVYDESSVDLYIELSKTKERLDLECLSSGEKQIVSLFSRICLDIDHNFIVLFDEPELSLSVYWQKTLLKDVLESGKCPFLFAVTHSPFIYEDGLSEYAHSMFDLENYGEK